MARRCAFTLVEGLFTSAILVSVLLSIGTFLYHSRVWSTRATDQVLAVGELRVALERLTHELRQGRSVIYPAAGRKSQPAVGFIDERSATVFYRLVPGPGNPPAAPMDLVRETLDGQREMVARHVTRFLVTASVPARAKDPQLVRLVLTREMGRGAAGDEVGVSLVDTVAVHALRSRCMGLRVGEP